VRERQALRARRRLPHGRLCERRVRHRVVQQRGSRLVRDGLRLWRTHVSRLQRRLAVQGRLGLRRRRLHGLYVPECVVYGSDARRQRDGDRLRRKRLRPMRAERTLLGRQGLRVRPLCAGSVRRSLSGIEPRATVSDLQHRDGVLPDGSILRLQAQRAHLRVTAFGLSRLATRGP
jgi:hypothetical protein